MPKFPSKEVDVLALARQMVAGYQSHAADFPSINGGWLDFICFIYAFTRKGQIEAHSQLQLATDNKNASLDTLRELMKNCLKKSQVDVTGNPEKLSYIGWGPKAPPTPADPPGQPRNLEVVTQEPSAVLLDWKPPARGSVRTYIIEQRNQLQGDGDFSNWQPVGTALETETTLTDQPRGPQLEYRIKAINTGGESVPSNSVAVVL